MLSALGGAGILLSDYTVVLRSDVAYTLEPCHETFRAARVDETTESGLGKERRGHDTGVSV